MADPDISQEEQEQIIFQFFVQAAQLPVVSGSIRSLPPSNRPPLNPDILCEIQGRGPVAFELVEIVTQAHVQEKENGKRLEKAFKAACERHSQIAVRFSDALIYVGFLKHITIRQRLSVVPEVVHELRQHSEDSMGYIEVPHKLQKFLTEISVTRGVSDGPAFGIMEMTDRTEEIFVQIEKKCKKKYSSEYSIELLAHYTNQPSSNSFDWQSEFHDYVLKILSGCPFKRVWVYDSWSKAIKYVHPGLDKGSRTEPDC